MARRGRRGGGFPGGGMMGSILSAIIVAGITIGAWNALPSSGGNIYEQAQDKSDALKSWYEDGWIFGKDPKFNFPKADPPRLDGGGSGGGKDFSAGDAGKNLEKLKVKEPQRVPYNRDEWKHWSKVSGMPSCWNTRDQVLYEESTKGKVVLVDKNDKKVSSVKNACKVIKGEWKDPYTGKTFTDPSKLDIDHMIPLSYAAKQGGQAWNADKKEKYANDLSNPKHLIAVEASANRQKGDQGPSTWKPSNKKYHCEYASDWIGISTQWKLSIPSADKKALAGMLKTC